MCNTYWEQTEEDFNGTISFEEDVKVLFTLAKETGIEFSFVEIDPITGLLDYDSLSGFFQNFR